MGAGNLAWHLGHYCLQAGIQVAQVYNRTPDSGEFLAAALNTSYTCLPDRVKRDADLYILAVSDDAIATLLNTGMFKNGQLVVHTAGSVSMDIFSEKASNYGVLYPLMTFTKGTLVDAGQVPWYIEANSAESLKSIHDFALKLSEKVYAVDSKQRVYLHLAAVIASNFTNHMFALAEKVLKERNLSFELLEPLIQETVAKAFSMSPLQAQTGPAIRNNHEVIQKHLALLEVHPETRKLYKVITESIMSKKI
jgi:predicted short-subunit dehydrogenase-like oxidoreductase (DUF2520 family)